MSHIYLARQAGLGAAQRHVVLKTIRRERAHDRRYIAMFLDEARLAASLYHQNIAQVFEVERDGASYFMAMEYIDGKNTDAVIRAAQRRRWSIPLELAVMIVSSIAAGLHHAHERRGSDGQPLRIVHRDVSPPNIMVGYDGSVKLVDFGIAKADQRIETAGGTIKGKSGYMSPEQCKGLPLDRRSDIFALGICLYELTTLRRAFVGTDAFDTMNRIVAGDVMPPALAVAGYPRDLERIVMTALATDPRARYQSAQDLIDALAALASSAPPCSNAQLARFLGHLFDRDAHLAPLGDRDETWIEVSRPDKTEDGTARRAPTRDRTQHRWIAACAAAAIGASASSVLDAVQDPRIVVPAIEIVEPVPAPGPRRVADPAVPVALAPRAPTIELRITTTPADATVSLDGQRLGATPFTGDVDAEPGSHVLEIRRRGYVTRVLDVDLARDVEHDLVLEPR